MRSAVAGRTWLRVTFYTTGMEHSITSATASAWERTPWHAVQSAARDALRQAEEQRHSGFVRRRMVRSAIREESEHGPYRKSRDSPVCAAHSRFRLRAIYGRLGGGGRS